MSGKKKYTGQSGQKYIALEPSLGKGGEGAVYRIKDNDSLVLKIFFEEKRTQEREKKLTAMTDMHLPDALTIQNTWPVDVVYEKKKFAGFVMKALKDTVPLNRIYMAEYDDLFPFDKKVLIAKNLCAAVRSVHKANQVVGDLNPNNICVEIDTGMVTLVDTNSYHITGKDGHVFRCEVGLAEYLPREIQEKLKAGTTLKDAPLPTFTKETDYFALAVHIFALLMKGCHPFACASDFSKDIDLKNNEHSVSAPQPLDNIKTGNFSFYNPVKGTKPPLYAPDFRMLPENIYKLFVKTFVLGNKEPEKRTGTLKWFSALDGMLKNLKRCKANEVHVYPAQNTECPWCQLERGVIPDRPPDPPPAFDFEEEDEEDKNPILGIQTGIGTEGAVLDDDSADRADPIPEGEISDPIPKGVGKGGKKKILIFAPIAAGAAAAAIIIPLILLQTPKPQPLGGDVGEETTFMNVTATTDNTTTMTTTDVTQASTTHIPKRDVYTPWQSLEFSLGDKTYELPAALTEFEDEWTYIKGVIDGNPVYEFTLKRNKNCSFQATGILENGTEKVNSVRLDRDSLNGISFSLPGGIDFTSNKKDILEKYVDLDMKLFEADDYTTFFNDGTDDELDKGIFLVVDNKTDKMFFAAIAADKIDFVITDDTGTELFELDEVIGRSL